ncbi:Npun_F0494 family protein [Chamaesiphon sp. VAR_69_metabat_338]|uniref:Npun_F0494 family protein n=1 Tax=Chamaesiphon sp. VAR_69_metabat_338 TaxID=2964704 RepID=UPI00286E42C1|nr:Npun_F0494 family protein [Chamaesiphon sp. VAR_69_metabat_338]
MYSSLFNVAIVVAYPSSSKVISYPAKTIERADIALRCAPFELNLFAKMRWESVSVPKLAGDLGVKSGYTRYPLSELSVETATNWLIQVGMLRREVDGQGLTDSFRLTPLGLALIEKWEANGGTIPSANLPDRLRNLSARWLRLPF